MPFPTDGYQPGTVQYHCAFTDANLDSSSIVISGPGASALAGWDDAFEAAVAAFRDSLLADIPYLNATVDRTITANATSSVTS